MDTRENFALYRKECKRCAYLDPDETKRYSGCHYSKGNTHCPAAEVQIVVVGKAHRMAQQLRAARDSRNAMAEAAILAEVAKQSQPFQSRFYDILDGAHTPEHRGSDE